MTPTLRDRVVDHARLVMRLLAERNGTSGDLPASGRSPEVVERIMHTLEELYAAAETLDGSAEVVEESVPDPAARRRAYGEMVDRIRDRLGKEVPPGAIVAIVTRGDAALLDIPGRTGWHFPQNELGVWAGYHPASGRDALEQLAALSRNGAGFFAVPGSSSWWLDFYDELRQQLDDRARLLSADDDLVLYQLDDGAAEAPPTGEVTRYEQQARSFVELANALLPVGARLLVVSRGDDIFLATTAIDARHFPSDHDGVYAGHPCDDGVAVETLVAAIDAGAGYLAIPAPLRWWEDVYPAFHVHLRRCHRCVADRAEAGLIYELNPPESGRIR